MILDHARALALPNENIHYSLVYYAVLDMPYLADIYICFLLFSVNSYLLGSFSFDGFSLIEDINSLFLIHGFIFPPSSLSISQVWLFVFVGVVGI